MLVIILGYEPELFVGVFGVLVIHSGISHQQPDLLLKATGARFTSTMGL